jgi:protein-tyrosine-phosphatase/predicted ATP-grasp superfamily ATP-dependent carboligase
MKILILDSHSNAGMACIQSLGKAGYDIYTASNVTSTLSQSSIYGKKFYSYPSPMKYKEKFIDFIVNLNREYSFDYILPVTDNTIYPLMEVSDVDLTRILILPNKDTFESAFNKEKTLLLAQKLDVPVPSNTYVTNKDFNLDEFSDFPLFVKPVQSKGISPNGSFNLEPVLVESSSHLGKIVKEFLKYTPVQIQQCVPGVGIGIEVLCRRGKIIRAFAHKRVHELPLTGGGSSYRKSIPMPKELFEYSERLMESLDWNGVAMVEFKSENDNHWLMEINGRFWGSLPLAIHAGIDFPKLLIDMLAGNNIPENYSYNENLYVRNIVKDLDWFKLNLKADKNNPRLITHGVGRSILEVFRIFTSKEKWDHVYFNDLNVFLSQIKIILNKEFITLKNKIKKSLVLSKFKRKGMLELPEAKNILVLCYGNICRSPFVEHLLLSTLAGTSYEVRSSGFHKNVNRTSPASYRELCNAEGVDLIDHTSSSVDAKLAGWADIILLMDYKNYELVLSDLDSSVLKKCYFLGSFSKGDVEISDPYGKEDGEVLKVLGQMKRSVINFGKILSTQ